MIVIFYIVASIFTTICFPLSTGPIFRLKRGNKTMSTIIELSIFPTDKGISVSPYVARVMKIIESSGLPHELNPMGTCIEGEWPAVLDVVDQCFKELQRDCDRIYLTLKADYRKKRSGGLGRKVASVKSKM
jgi:uncharacterized protein (TIGR00106 family)